MTSINRQNELVFGEFCFMKRLLIVHCLIAVQLLLVCHVFASEQRVFKVGSFDDYPLIFKDKDGTDKGLYVDLLSEIGKKENIKFIYVFGTWNEGLDRIKSGEVDILTDVGYTLERAQYMDYCKNSLLTFWGELYTLKSSEIYGLLDIKDMKIGVLKGDIFAENFLELINKFNITCEIVELQSYNDIFKAISENRVDAGVAAGSFKKDDQKKYGIKSTGFVFSPLDVFFTTGKGKNNELRDLLDKYLNEWKYQENSVFNKAKQQWLYASADTVDVIPGWLINTLFIAGMVFFVGIVFIVILKLQVKRVTSKIIDSEQLIKSISDNLQNGMIYSIIVDPNGFRKFTYLSNSVKLLYGIDAGGRLCS